MELEKKKQRGDKNKTVPTTRYHSFSVPVVGQTIKSEGTGTDEDDPILRFGKYERTLLSFSRDIDFKEAFGKFKNVRPPPRSRRCVISGYVVFYVMIWIFYSKQLN